MESSTTNCSVGIVQGSDLCDLIESNEGYTHAENIAVFVQRVLDKCRLQVSELDAVAIGKGPGSYTGLRIGTALAKGICYASSLPLIAVNSLKSMAAEVHLKENQSDIFLPLLDARRMEVYAAVFDRHLKQLDNTHAEVLAEDSFAKYVNSKLAIFGPGAAKFHKLCKGRKNIHFVEDIFPSVKGMRYLVSEYYENQDFEDLAYFEPFYLKDFIAGQAKKIL